MDDYIIRYLDTLPISIKGMTTRDAAGDYNIYINPKHSHNIQKNTVLHELRHVNLNHFNDYTKNIKDIEREAR